MKYEPMNSESELITELKRLAKNDSYYIGFYYRRSGDYERSLSHETRKVKNHGSEKYPAP